MFHQHYKHINTAICAHDFESTINKNEKKISKIVRLSICAHDFESTINKTFLKNNNNIKLTTANYLMS